MPLSRKKAPTPPSTKLDAHAVIKAKSGVFKDTCLQFLDHVRDQEGLTDLPAPREMIGAVATRLSSVSGAASTPT